MLVDTKDFAIFRFVNVNHSFYKSYCSYEYPRICIIMNGETVLKYGVQFVTCNTSTLLVLSPDSAVKVKTIGNTNALAFDLDESIFKMATMSTTSNLQNNNSIKSSKLICTNVTMEIQDVVSRLNKLLMKEMYDPYILKLYMLEFVHYLQKINNTSSILGTNASRPISKAIKTINDSFMLPITMKQIAHESGMSESGFSQAFKKSIGISPKNYLTTLRMEYAKNMLIDQNVTETALDLGYEYASRFIDVFRKKYGMTPLQYKRRKNK